MSYIVILSNTLLRLLLAFANFLSFTSEKKCT